MPRHRAATRRDTYTDADIMALTKPALLACIAEHKYPSVHGLRKHGAMGGDTRIYDMRDELLARDPDIHAALELHGPTRPPKRMPNANPPCDREPPSLPMLAPMPPPTPATLIKGRPPRSPLWKDIRAARKLERHLIASLTPAWLVGVLADRDRKPDVPEPPPIGPPPVAGLSPLEWKPRERIREKQIREAVAMFAEKGIRPDAEMVHRLTGIPESTIKNHLCTIVKEVMAERELGEAV